MERKSRHGSRRKAIGAISNELIDKRLSAIIPVTAIANRPSPPETG